MSNARNGWLAAGLTATLISGAAMWEGFSATPYQDIANVATVCYGLTGPDVIQGKTYTKAECARYLERELRHASAGVLECTNVPISQAQHDAFSLFAYNLGTGAYCKSSLLKKLNAGDYEGACQGLMAWNQAKVRRPVMRNGHVVKDAFGRVVFEWRLEEVRGLTRRRQFERDLCMKG